MYDEGEGSQCTITSATVNNNDDSDSTTSNANVSTVKDSGKAKDSADDGQIVSKFDEYLAEFMAPKEETCEVVSASLANGVNKMFQRGMDFDIFRKKSTEIKRPENCQELRSQVETDELVLKLLKHQTKKFDDRMKIIQTAVSKAGCCLTKMVDSIQKHVDKETHSAVFSDTVANVLTAVGMTGLAMLGHGFHNICLQRRELQKPELAWRYENLFSADVEHIGYLYGGSQNVERMIKDIGDSNKAVSQLRPGKSPYYPTRGAYRYPRYRGGFSPRGQYQGPGPMRRGRGNRPTGAPYPSQGMYNYGMKRSGGMQARSTRPASFPAPTKA